MKLLISIITLITVCIFTTANLIQTYYLVHPIVRDEEIINEYVEKIQKRFPNARKRIVEQIVNVSLDEKIDPLFIAALVFTESNFDPDVRSVKNYHGLMQIPKPPIPDPDINVRIGIRIFKEKLENSNSLRDAILAYKGYTRCERGYLQVAKVFKIYTQLKKE